MICISVRCTAAPLRDYAVLIYGRFNLPIFMGSFFSIEKKASAFLTFVDLLQRLVDVSSRRFLADPASIGCNLASHTGARKEIFRKFSTFQKAQILTHFCHKSAKNQDF